MTRVTAEILHPQTRYRSISQWPRKSNKVIPDASARRNIEATIERAPFQTDHLVGSQSLMMLLTDTPAYRNIK
jgi:hypothetical protein